MKSDKEQTGLGMTEYHDTQEVYRELKNLISIPARDLKPVELQNYLTNYFDEKCKKSKIEFERASKVIPGGVQHNQAFPYPFPIAFIKAKGAHLEDVDGNTYIDFLAAGGATLLGSAPDIVCEKAKEVIDSCGPCTGVHHEYETLLAEFIVDRFPGIDKVRLLGSGTEAVMGAIRLARAHTKKKKIIKLGAGFHGWSDQVSYAQRISGIGGLESHGIPRAIYKHTQEVYPNDIDAMERMLKRNRYRGGTAAVIIEPMGPESGTRPLDYDYPAKVRTLCDKYGALLIFDEVVTGFRVGMSGAQGYFGVTPDITTLGKIMAGGYPAAGALGGSNKVMESLAGGIGGKKGKKAHVGGTLAANPLSSMAGYITLSEMERTNACEVAAILGDRLTIGLKKLVKKYNLPFVAYNQGSMVHLETVGTVLFDINLFKLWELPGKIKEIHKRKDIMTHMGAAYMAEGLVTVGGSRMFTTAAMNNEIIDDAITRFERVFQKVEGV